MLNLFWKKVVVFIVFMLFLGVALAPSLPASYLVSSPSPLLMIDNTLYVGGTGPNNYTRIQDAIDNASRHDTVYVYSESSPYIECLEVDKSINLIGENRDTTVIDANYPDPDIYGYSFYIHANYVTISGFTIIHGNGGIVLQYSIGCNITGNNISTNRWYGVKFFKSRFNTIKGNIIIDNPEGISFTEASMFNRITSNNISNNQNRGIFFTGFSNFNKIIKNNFFDNDPDAYFIFAFKNRWMGNYWNSPQTLPKCISGIIGTTLPIILIPWVNFDWRPALEPYDI
jgi:parallel beta-helix repeat protein